MSKIRFFLALALTAITGAVVGGLTLAAPARADTPREPVCKIISTGGKMDANVQAFMAEQLAAGKTDFVSPVSSMLCAW